MHSFQATTRDVTRKLYARYYGASSRRPVTKAIHTQINERGRSPCLDLAFSGKDIQPYIHDCAITIVYRKTTTKFQIFVKNHKRLPRNQILDSWGQGSIWRGDIVVMRKGVCDEVVNLRSGDALLADFAVKKFVEKVKQKPRFRIPKRSLIFKKK